MRAMVHHAVGRSLALEERAAPDPGPGQALIRVHACAVCRTDLHVVDGDLPPAQLPIIPGHEVVGTIEALGPSSGEATNTGLTVGTRVGVPWLGWTCGRCAYCRSGRENLCPEAKFTGYTLDGGFAEYLLADTRFCFALPERYDDGHAAPLLCAGLIGYRAYRFAKDAETIGLYGFGAAAHILAQVAVQQGRRIFAFTKPGDTAGQDFAKSLGAVWAGGSDEPPPEALDAALLFAPVGALVPQALRAVKPGGTVVCAGIHMSDIPSFPYADLWQERRLVSVANLTRQDGQAFLEAAAKTKIDTHIHAYALEDANRALDDLRHGRFEGAAVLFP